MGSGDGCGRDVRAKGLQTSRCSLPKQRPWGDCSITPPGLERARSVGARHYPAHDEVVVSQITLSAFVVTHCKQKKYSVNIFQVYACKSLILATVLQNLVDTSPES